MDPALELVRVGAVLGGFLPYVSPCWPTSDHVIPARLFDLCYARLPAALALQRVNQRGVALNSPRVDQDAAFPDVPDA